MQKISDVASFRALMDAPSSSSLGGVVVHVGASWCQPCAELNEYLESSAIPKYAGCGIAFAYVDADTLPEICESEEVETVPFVAFYRRKAASGAVERVADVAGAKIPAIELNLRSLFGNGNDDRSKFATLDDYITSLIRRDKIVMFITGTPSRPRCGFTRKVVDLMEKYQAQYSFVDIMSDDEMCQRLKVFSNWPTFPQIYVDGELLGGCDILLQMDEEGELKAGLKL